MLECRDLSVFYGFHQALDGVSINIKSGEIVAILGANGAGKTTLLRAIAGLIDFDDDDDYEEHYEKYQNEILFNGESIFDWDPHEVVELGLSLVPEGRSLFGELTVIENLKLGAYPLRAQKTLSQNLEKVLSIFPKLADRRNQTTRFMSGGEQQMVAVGRALMSEPDILMLDEPSLGLSPILCGELFNAISEIREANTGILLVEQNAKRSLEIADRCYLIETGRIATEDTVEGLKGNQTILRSYLGGEVRFANRYSERLTTRTILSEEISELTSKANRKQKDHVDSLRTSFNRPDLLDGEKTDG